MPEPFKNHINAESVAAIATIVKPPFDRERFVRVATDGLESLELKARVVQIADALREAIPTAFPEALEQIRGGLSESREGGVADAEVWVYWPLCTFIERHGLEHPEVSLDAMAHLTKLFSCEFAIRPFFAADPVGVTARLERWARDPNVHVRRLASEGSRPRLPWGIRLSDRIEHPDRLLPVLTALRDDPEEYVRRSVANHLNDIAKDHPDRVLAIAADWLEGADRNRTRLVKHALRTHIKAGDPRAYALIGLLPFEGTVSTSASPDRIAVGEAVTLRATLTSKSDRAQRVRLDLGVHHRRKDGRLSAKVFHWTVRTVKPGETLELTKVHTVRKVTTRRLYAGEQGIDLRVNGAAGPRIPFVLDVP